MNSTYKILTDSSCDMPVALVQELGLDVVPLSVQYQGQDYDNYPNGDSRNKLNMTDFYNGLRNGALTSTTAANPEKWSAAMEPVLAQGLDLLVLAFSSGLSATYTSAVLAAGELAERYPDRKIRVVDTLCASMGQGLLVYLAAQLQKEGQTLEQYLSDEVFASAKGSTMQPDAADVAGFDAYTARFASALPVQRAACEHLK